MRCINYNGCAQRPHMVPYEVSNLLQCFVCKTIVNPESGLIVPKDMAITHNPGHYDNIVDEEEAESPYTGGW